MVPSLFNIDNEYPDYFEVILPRAHDCSLTDSPDTRSPLKWFLHCLSFKITGYPNALLIPFTTACLPLVYYLGYYLSKDRLVGLIAITSMLFNPLYSDWARTGTYDNVFTFFMLLSLVLIFKSSPASLTSWIVAIFSKSFSLAFFPMWAWTLHKIKHKDDMIIIGILLLALGITLVHYYADINKIVGAEIGFYGFDSERLEKAIFTNLSLFWKIIPALAILGSLSLQFKTKTIMPNRKLVWTWILYIFLTTPIIFLFTLQGTFTYRYLILGTFMSIMIGMVLVQLGNWYVEQKLKKAIKANPIL